MSTLHIIIQKSLLSLFALCFMFVTIYVPQSWNKVHEAEAGFSTFAGQMVQLVEEAATAIYSGITSAATVAIEWFQSSMWSKAFVLDGYAWWAIKLVIAQITRSIVNWINSGFEGAPTFVQDLEGFLLNVGGQVAGLYLQQLGMPGIAAFICAPFRLNIQIAFATNYRMSRSGYPYGVGRCDLSSGVLGGFVGGNFNGAAPGSGWDNWYRVSTRSNTYTPYGSLMAAEHEAALRMQTSIGVENRYLQFGNGFFSNKICDTVSNPAFPKSKCMVSTPGNVISEALNFQLSTGVRSMIAADEINEIIGALMGQVAKTAMMGVNGLLGMSSNTGYTIPTGPNGLSYADEQVADHEVEGAPILASYLTTLDKQLAIENNYLSLIDSAVPLLNLLGTTDSVAEALRATELRLLVATNIAALEKIKTDLLAGIVPVDQLIADYTKLDLHSDTQIKADMEKWMGMFTLLYEESVRLVNDAISTVNNTYLPQLLKIPTAEAIAQVNLINNTYNPDLIKLKAELDKIAIEWNDPFIPKVDTLQHYIDLRNGTIPGVPALFTYDQYETVISLWQKITGII